MSRIPHQSNLSHLFLQFMWSWAINHTKTLLSLPAAYQDPTFHSDHPANVIYVHVHSSSLLQSWKQMKAIIPHSSITKNSLLTPIKRFEHQPISRRFVANMSAANEFLPEKVRAVVSEVASLLKERKETVSVAETVCCSSLISTYDLFMLLLKFPNFVGPDFSYFLHSWYSVQIFKGEN
jgi:hypothetical protein